MDSIFVDDVGTEVRLDCMVDISSATSVKIIARPPRGGKKEWVGTVEGPTCIKYVLVDGDVDQAGTWKLQAFVDMPGWRGRGGWAEIEVLQ